MERHSPVLASLVAAIKRHEGSVTVEATRNRPDEPVWTLLALGEISGVAFSIEVHGDSLGGVVFDAANIADTLGIDVMADLRSADDG